MNNEIKNEKIDVMLGKKLNDNDCINLLLTLLKEINKNYVCAMTEVSNEVLYNEYKMSFENFSNIQREVYELMFRNGWYSIEKPDKNKINSEFYMLNQKINNLNKES